MGCGNSKDPAQPSVQVVPGGADVTPKLDDIFQQMKISLELKDRQWMGGTYKNCLDAKDIVDFLVSEQRGNFCPTREKAVEVCRELQAQSLIVHVWGSQKFKFLQQQTSPFLIAITQL